MSTINLKQPDFIEYMNNAKVNRIIRNKLSFFDKNNFKLNLYISISILCRQKQKLS